MKTTELLKLALKTFRTDDNAVVGDSGGRVNETVVNLSKNKKFRKLTHVPNIKATEKLNFLTSNAKKVFNHLWLAFIKALILQHFDLENHIQIKTDISGYAISRVLNQLNFNSDAALNDLNKSNFS